MIRKIIVWADQQVNRIFKSKPLQRIVKNSSYLVTATGFTAALGMVQGIFVARTLGPAGLGLWGAIKSFANMLNRLTSFRINELVVRFVSLYEEKEAKDQASAVFRFAAILEILGAVAAFLLICLFAEFGARWLTDSQTLINLDMSMMEIKQLFILYGLHILFNLVFDSSTGLIQVFNRFKEQAIITAIQGVLTLIFISIAIYLNSGLVGIITAYLMGKIVGAVGMTSLAFVTARKTWGNGWLFSSMQSLKKDRKEIFSFAFSTNLSSTISLIAKDSESLWVNALVGNAAGGYYGLALSLIGLLQIPITPLPNTTYPELTREAAKENWREVKNILNRGTRLSAVYSIPVALGLTLFGKWIIGFIYGVEFLPAYSILMILVVGYFVMNLFYWNRVALLSLNRPVFPTVMNFVGMLVKISLMFIFIPPLGIPFMAILFSGYMIFTVGAAVVRVNSDLNERIRTQDATFEEGAEA